MNPRANVPAPWRRVASGQVHDFEVVKVHEDQFAHPGDGSVHPRVLFECPDWVNVIALTADDQVVLVRQFRFGVGAATLELPGGMVDAGEDPGAAGLRELEEETGFRARSSRLLGSIHPNPAWQNNRCHTYLAEGCKRAHAPKLDPGEDIAVELFPKSALPDLLRDGSLTHACVVSALCWFFLERGMTTHSRQTL